MTYSQIDIESRLNGQIKVVYLNQPESFNSLNRTMLKELREFMKECNVDNDVKCIAISGRGKAFCSGQNIKEMFSIQNEVEEERIIQRIIIDYYNPLVKSIFFSPKPVVALVNGPATGEGAMLALLCDFAVAKEDAYFSQAFLKLGLIPNMGGTYYLPRMLGRQLASYWTFTDKKLSAKEAREIGFIADVFSENEYENKSAEILERIAGMPSKAVGLTKKAFYKSYSNSFIEQLDLESIYQQRVAENDNFREGIAAFLEKRKPHYR